MTHRSSLHEELKQLLNKYDENMELYEKHYQECKEVYDAVLNIPFVKNLKAENEFLKNSMKQIANSLNEEMATTNKIQRQEYEY